MSKGTIGTSMITFTPNKEKKPTLNELKARLDKTKDRQERKRLQNKIRIIKQKIKASRKKVQKYITDCTIYYPDRVKKNKNESTNQEDQAPNV